MATGIWKVQCNIINGEKRYIPYRLRNTEEVMHSGNIEHYGAYTTDEAEAQALVDELNGKGEDDE